MATTGETQIAVGNSGMTEQDAKGGRSSTKPELWSDLLQVNGSTPRKPS